MSGAADLRTRLQELHARTAETPLFSKSRLLYGMALARDAIRESRQVILLEGYMDWIALHRRGLANALAGMGTALTEDQARLIRRIAASISCRSISSSSLACLSVVLSICLLPLALPVTRAPAAGRTSLPRCRN